MTSDLHLGHANIIKYSGRPFTDVDHMREMLIKHWNETVSANDTVYILGDVAMGRREETLPALLRMNGHKVLFPGNHDNCSFMYSEKKNWLDTVEMYTQYMEIDYTTTTYNNGEFNLSHFPYKEPHGLDYKGRDFSAYQLEDNGVPLLMGHVHELWKEKRTDKGTLMVNIGVDARNYTPISIDDVRTIIKNSS